MSRSHTPRHGDFLLNSKNFSLLCDFCKFHPSHLPELYHYTINDIGRGQIFGSSSLCSVLHLPIDAFLSGPNKYFVSILENGTASIQPIQNKNMLLPYNERPTFGLLSNSGQNYNSCIFRRLRITAKCDY